MLTDRSSLFGCSLAILTFATSMAAKERLEKIDSLSWSKQGIDVREGASGQEIVRSHKKPSNSLQRKTDGSSGGVGFYAAGVTAIAGATTLVCSLDPTPVTGAACAVGLLTTLLSGLAGVLKGLGTSKKRETCFVLDAQGNELFDLYKCDLSEVYSYDQLKDDWLSGKYGGDIHLVNMSIGDGEVYQVGYSYNPYIGNTMVETYEEFKNKTPKNTKRSQDYKGYHQLMATNKILPLNEASGGNKAKANYFWRDWDYSQERAVADHQDDLRDIAYKLAYDDPKIENYEVFELNLYNGDAIAECGVVSFEPDNYEFPDRQALLEALCTSAPT